MLPACTYLFHRRSLTDMQERPHLQFTSKPSRTPSPSPVVSTSSTTATTPSSPAQEPQDLLDDIFSSSHQEHPPDSPRLRSIHSTAGYRDGIALARAESVQKGFDEGYLLGAAVGSRIGVLLGIVEGMLQALPLKQDSEHDEAKARLERLQITMKQELALDNVLGPEFMGKDGSWAWDVPEEAVERGGVQAVAEAHPVLRRWSGVLAEWVSVLGVRRRVEEEAGKG